VKEDSSDERFVAAKSKFDTGVAMLQAIDPTHPMVYFFLQKKMEWDKEKKKQNMKFWILIIACFMVFIGIAIYLYFSGELSKESPLEKIINKYLQ
jgi:flagellar basal body-associated protein FliL